MTVEELVSELAALCPETVVTVTDPHLHVECHPRLEVTALTVSFKSSGHVVTEEDVS